jgi:hypothetical protein
LTHDSEGIELVFLAYADDIAVAVSSDPKNATGMSIMHKVVELVDVNDEDENTTLLQKTLLSGYQISVCVVLQFKWSITQSFLSVKFDYKLR